MTGSKVAIATLPTPSTALTSDVELVRTVGSAEIRYEFDRDGALFRGVISFHKVRAGRWRAEGHCTAWHIKDCYDTVAEVEESDWVEELRHAAQTTGHRSWVMRHFMIYLDSAGCFEFVAESANVATVEPVT
jgi:hypothetical protein